MIGLTVLVVIALYIGFWWWVIRLQRNRSAKIAAMLVALAIPFWDLPIGYFNFYRHCANDGGMHVVSTFPSYPAVFIDSSAGYRPEEVFRFGFKIVEYDAGGQVIRYTVRADGIEKSTHQTPASSLKIKFSGHQILPWNLVRSDYVAARIDDGQIVAKQTSFRWLGLWWQVENAPLLGSGPECSVSKDQSMLALVARGTR